jgi:predicted nucleic acid-binding protein
MQLVIDANILIAAFLKSANTRKLIFNEDIKLFAPEYFALEINRLIKKDTALRRRIGINKEEAEELLAFLLERIKIIPKEEYNSFIEKAKKVVPDDDAPYLALSLALKIPIWSNDAIFKKQNLTVVYTTSELLKILA